MSREPFRGKIRSERTGPEIKISIHTLDGQEVAACLMPVKEAESFGEAVVHQARNKGAF